MPHYSEKALQVLKDKGYRITRPRRLVVETLEKSTVSMSPYEIQAFLEQAGEHIDTVSVYRILECLEENHLVHRLLLQHGKVLKCRLEHEEDCHLHQDDHCHHFLICRGCDTIQEMHCVGLKPVAEEVRERSGFIVENHHLEFVGLCQPCASKG